MPSPPHTERLVPDVLGRVARLQVQMFVPTPLSREDKARVRDLFKQEKAAIKSGKWRTPRVARRARATDH